MTIVRVGDKDMDEEDLVRYAWTTGTFLEERLDPLQLELDRTFDHMRPRTRAFILESRKIGKTYGFLCYADKLGRRKPRSVIRMAYPTKLQGKTIILPLMEEMQADCPTDLKWVNREAQDGCWVLPHTGSRLYLAGTDDSDQIDRLRGPKSDLILLDEVPTFKSANLHYLINSVLWPQTLNTGGLLLMSGTPPTSMDHPSVDLIRRAETRGLLIRKTIFDNPRMTPEIIREICREANPDASEEKLDKILSGEEEGTPHWEREFMCRLVSDEEERVTPEFEKSIHVAQIPQGIPTLKMLFMDAGHVKDLFAGVFAEIDFGNQTLRCLAEYAELRKSTNEIRESMIKIEKFLGWEDEDVLRYLDQTAKQQIYDFNSWKDPISGKRFHVLPGVRSPGKGQLVVDLKNYLGQGRVLVSPSCKRLIMSLEHGIWTDAKKEDFQRTPTLGHLDLLDALAQGCMVVRQTGKWQHNPHQRETNKGYISGKSFTEGLTKKKELGYTVMSALMPRRRNGNFR